MRDVREGLLKDGLPYMTFGDDPLLAVFPGLRMTNANPTGIQRWGELRLLSPLVRAVTVYRVGRRLVLETGTTMTNLANDYAGTLDEVFGGADDVLSISTGGSVILQLAADRSRCAGSWWPARPTGSASTDDSVRAVVQVPTSVVR